jgi:hypothetical protein
MDTSYTGHFRTASHSVDEFHQLMKALSTFRRQQTTFTAQRGIRHAVHNIDSQGLAYFGIGAQQWDKADPEQALFQSTR